MDKKVIAVQEQTQEERRKRQREIILALVGTVLIVVFTWVELRLLGRNSYLFFAFFNLNLVLLLFVLFLVLRNTVKLILDRRRRALGSELRTRLVIAFVILSVVPTFVMFLLTLRFVQTSVDYWFQVQVEASMDQALGVVQDFYASAKSGLETKAEGIRREVQVRRIGWSGKELNTLLEAKRREYRLSLVGVVAGRERTKNWRGDAFWGDIWPQIQAEAPWSDVFRKQKFWGTMLAYETSDLVVGILPLDSASSTCLVLGAKLGPGFLGRLEEIARGVGEYKQLRSLKYPLKMTLYMVLGLMSLMIFLGATWFGFRLARELSAPIQALALGTQRIASGDFSVRLKDKSRDELGLLVQSFNRMAEDLEQKQASLILANRQLEEQNQSLNAKNQYVQAILENITAGVVSLDRAGRITTMNRAAESILGIEGRNLVGKSVLELLGSNHQELIHEAAALFRTSPASQWQRRVEVNVGGEPVKLLINAVALLDSEGRDSGIVAVFENISELEKMQRFDAWKEVAQRIAHEIKNPLTPIKLSAQRLQRKFGPAVEDAVFTQCTDLIIKQVEHLQEMVREFSAFAKLPEVVLSAGRIDTLLREAVSVFSESHTAITWTVRMEKDVPIVLLDAQAMQRVFYNILLNAAEVLAGQVDAAVDISLVTHKRKDRVYVAISDNGPGIKPKEQVRMFEPYYSTKRSGSGLGLSIAKSIVSDHRGYIRVKTHEPTGTTFIIELPVVRDEMA